MHVYQHIHISYTHMFPLGYVHVFIFFQKFAPRPRKHPLKPLILKNLLLQESGLSKGAILALNSDTLKMERQKLLRAQDPGPGDTGDTEDGPGAILGRPDPGSDGLGSLWFVE